MGFTHYWYTQLNGIPESAWELICADVRKLLANLPAHSTSGGSYYAEHPLEIAWEHDEPGKSPEITDSLIRFNGTDGQNDLGHETFFFERTPERRGWQKDEPECFACCKTARKPYDLVVCAALIVAHKHASEYVRIESDGDKDDWIPALDWVTQTLGGSYAIPIGRDAPDTPETEQDTKTVPEEIPEPDPEPVVTTSTIRVDVAEFRTALEIAYVERKTTIPILACVYIRPHESCLQVVGTDLDMWTITTVPALLSDSTAPFILPHRKVLDLLKGESGLLTITAMETSCGKDVSHNVKLEMGGITYDLPSMSPVNFPELPKIPEYQFTVRAADLKGIIGRTSFAISKEYRYTLNGAQFDAGNGRLQVIATDGYRLALDKVFVEGIPAANGIIHKTSLDWLLRRLNTGDVLIHLGDGAHRQSFFHINDLHTTFVARNLTGQFPNYAAVMPREDSFTVKAVFSRPAELSKTLTKVARMADERSGVVKWTVNDSCHLSAFSTESGTAKASVQALIQHIADVPEIVIGFNSDYILDVLKVAGKAETVLHLKDSNSAGMFTITDLPEWTCVVMPMRY